MNQKTIIICIALFILIVVGMFTFAYLKKQEIKIETPVVTEQKELPYPLVTGITAKHYFIDSVHTFVGEITLPTPCDLLQSQALVRESMPEQVALDFSVINTAQTCAQQTTNQRFKTSAIASEGATFSAQFMGRTVPLNLIPAASGETPEEFELFIKG